eukprot:8961288-Pyramimonas_sp.AAC.1
MLKGATQQRGHSWTVAPPHREAALGGHLYPRLGFQKGLDHARACLNLEAPRSLLIGPCVALRGVALAQPTE